MVQGKSWSLDRSWIHTLYLDAYFEDALTKMRAKTGLGSTYALFTALNEFFHEWGYMEEKGYLYHKQKYAVPLVKELETKIDLENETKDLIRRKKELELKKLGPITRPDYTKLAIEELQKEYELAKVRDPVGVQLIAFEFKRRGVAEEVV